jgi:hypothetical protein
MEHTARHFDEIILDDFFFTSCKSDVEIAAKGTRSWTDYRLKLMAEAARDLILAPARAVNPRVRVIIKYPNWYDHFQGAGFDLETGPKLFDGIYTGTETRDPMMSAQHLQPWLSYGIVRYFDAIAPGRNGGGWVDPGGMKTFDRYAEQLALTLFARAPEINLFDFRQLARPITLADRAPWQGQKTSFDFDAATGRGADGALPADLTIATPAGWTFAMLDPVIGQLGKPIGIASYRPFHSTGESFVHTYLGMIGIPVELGPEFPSAARTILLAEDAKADPEIVAKIRAALVQGRNVVITSGLLRALQDRGLSDIVEMRVTDRKALVQDFTIGFDRLHRSDKPVLIPQIDYLTNDSWEDAAAIDGWNGWPMLHDADYSKGHLFVLTVPDNFADLYALPPALLDRIRQSLAGELFVRLEGPSKVALFPYDNGSFVIESFRDEAAELGLVADGRYKRLRDLQTGELIDGRALAAADVSARRKGWAASDAGKTRFAVKLRPHSFRAFRAE